MNDHNPKKPISRTLKLDTFNQTFKSSIFGQNQKFAFDKTLFQGIKQNDPSKIVNNTEERDLGEANKFYDQQKQVHDIFVSTRKDFDKTKKVVNKTEFNLERIKKQKQIVLAEKAKIEASFTEEQQEFKTIQQQLERLNSMCEVADYEKNVILQMSKVLKQDILFYKKRCFQANTKILRNQNKLKTLNGQFESTKTVTSNCRSLIYSIQKKIVEKQVNRYEKINSYHEIINKKIENNVKREQRERIIEESMLEALNGKMPEEQQQKKLLLTNLVVKKMLKLKMEGQMQKFHEIETTFRKIKENTTVKRADQFIGKFIKREKNYGELLSGISKNQEKINLLKRQNQILQKQLEENLQNKHTIEEKENQKRSETHKQLNFSIELLRQRLLKNQFLKNKTLSFSTKFLTAFEQRSFNQVKQHLSRQTPHKSLKEVLEKVNSFLDSFKIDEGLKLKQIQIESKNITFSEKIKARNIRIATVPAQSDQNIQSAFQKDDENISQKQFFNQNRKQIKKSLYLKNRIKTRAI